MLKRRVGLMVAGIERRADATMNVLRSDQRCQSVSTLVFTRAAQPAILF